MPAVELLRAAGAGPGSPVGVAWSPDGVGLACGEALVSCPGDGVEDVRRVLDALRPRLVWWSARDAEPLVRAGAQGAVVLGPGGDPPVAARRHRPGPGAGLGGGLRPRPAGSAADRAAGPALGRRWHRPGRPGRPGGPGAPGRPPAAGLGRDRTSDVGGGGPLGPGRADRPGPARGSPGRAAGPAALPRPAAPGAAHRLVGVGRRAAGGGARCRRPAVRPRRRPPAWSRSGSARGRRTPRRPRPPGPPGTTPCARWCPAPRTPTCATRRRCAPCSPGSASTCPTPGPGGWSRSAAPTRWSRRCSTGGKAERIATTYGYGWLDRDVGADGRLRGVWTGCDGAAGRMTASAGLHNLPAELRPAVAAEPGRLLVRADLGQMEPRVLAAVSGDDALARATADDDLYAPVAARLGVDRPTAKVAVLAAMYGQTSGAAGEALRGLERAYPVAMGYLRAAHESGAAGRDVATYGGRQVRMWPLPEPVDPRRVRRARSVRPQRRGPGCGRRAVQDVGGDGPGRAAGRAPRWCSACTTSCSCRCRSRPPTTWSRCCTGCSPRPRSDGRPAAGCGSWPTSRWCAAGRRPRADRDVRRHGARPGRRGRAPWPERGLGSDLPGLRRRVAGPQVDRPLGVRRGGRAVA